MSDLKITTANGLIQATIKSKQETYYLLTEDNINSLKQKNVFADLFLFLASLAWGAYFSVITTAKSIPAENINSSILQTLGTLGIVFLVSGILFSIFASIMIYFSFNQIQKIKKSKIELGNNNYEDQQKIKSIIILSATYEWGTGQVDVTRSIKDLVEKGVYQGRVEPPTFGIQDPIHGTVKTLKIHYKVNGEEKNIIAKDSQTFIIE